MPFTSRFTRIITVCVRAVCHSSTSCFQGPQVLGIRFGNHVGDWEHIVIRFVDGIPAYIWLSVHDWGDAYSFTALEKRGLRPVTYIATGTHANYATVGTHAFILPLGLLSDRTDAGRIWDITKNYRGFWYDVLSQSFSSAGGAGIGGRKQMSEGSSWLTWTGRWGDQQYPNSDSRQICILDQCHYVTGPTGKFPILFIHFAWTHE